MATQDAEQVVRARAGDHQAYRALVEHHSRRLFALAYRMTGSEPDAEDIVQETFMKAHRRLEEYESRAGFGSWLYRIATNCALDLLRARRRRGHAVAAERADDPDPVERLPAAGPDPERHAHGAELRRKVELAMRRLSPAERVAFVLRHFEERPIKEVAAAMGQSDSATKQAIFRAVKKLRRELAPVVAAPEGSQ